MGVVIDILIVLGLIGTVVPLVIGIGGMVRGGDFNAKYGNRLMRWRVTMQAISVALLVIGFWYKSQH